MRDNFTVLLHEELISNVLHYSYLFEEEGINLPYLLLQWYEDDRYPLLSALSKARTSRLQLIYAIYSKKMYEYHII